MISIYSAEVYIRMDHWLWIPHSFEKFENANFFKISKIPFYGVARMGLEPHQKFFQIFFQQIWSLEEFKVFAY